MEGQTKTPLTDATFEYAYSQALPEHGEGWYSFAGILRERMADLERKLDWLIDYHNITIEDTEFSPLTHEIVERQSKEDKQ